jgi:hypothetical protein
MAARMGIFPIFISLFYLAGFGLLGFGLWSAYRSTESADWPTADCTLSKLVLDERHDDGVIYQVQVEYSYTVAGNVYNGSRVAFGYGGSSNREPHDAIYTKLKNAKTISVRYNPADPATSTLSFGIHQSIKISLAFSVMWLGFVVGFTWLWWLSTGTDSVLLQNLSVQ